MGKGKKDHLKYFREEIRSVITSKYPTVEKFCYENDLMKSTMSRFLTGPGDEFQVKTLARIATAAGKNIKITAE